MTTAGIQVYDHCDQLFPIETERDTSVVPHHCLTALTRVLTFRPHCAQHTLTVLLVAFPITLTVLTGALSITLTVLTGALSITLIVLTSALSITLTVLTGALSITLTVLNGALSITLTVNTVKQMWLSGVKYANRTATSSKL